MRWRNLKGRLVLGVILAARGGGSPRLRPGERFWGGCSRLGAISSSSAHRGAPNQACENTLESFAQALRLGANALELDVASTRDEHLVLWHDWNETLYATGDPQDPPDWRCVTSCARRYMSPYMR